MIIYGKSQWLSMIIYETNSFIAGKFTQKSDSGTTSSHISAELFFCSSRFLGQTCSQNWTMRFMVSLVSLCPLISWVLFSSFGHLPISLQAVQLNDDYLRGSNQFDVLISFSVWIYDMYQYFLLLISSMWNIVISKICIPIDSVVRIMDMKVSEAKRLD